MLEILDFQYWGSYVFIMPRKLKAHILFPLAAGLALRFTY
jgi:hypothetical protein